MRAGLVRAEPARGPGSGTLVDRKVESTLGRLERVPRIPDENLPKHDQQTDEGQQTLDDAILQEPRQGAHDIRAVHGRRRIVVVGRHRPYPTGTR